MPSSMFVVIITLYALICATVQDQSLGPSEESHNVEQTELVVGESTTNQTMDLHEMINKQLAADEERVLAGGEVKVRKKRTFCKKCYPSYSYGYGGGGGCCGACGQCGGGYVRPIRIKVIPVPVYGGGYGGGCGSCYRPCNVCGRKK